MPKDKDPKPTPQQEPVPDAPAETEPAKEYEGGNGASDPPTPPGGPPNP